MTDDSKSDPTLDWLEAELADTLDEDYELEISEPALSMELRRIYREAHPPSLERKDYFVKLLTLQSELIKLQDWVQATGEKIVVIFEGRDSAGKGGVIKRITQRLNPRVVRVVALPAPSDREKSQWYFQRYVPHLPAAGEIVLFDRSWYNRSGVERVMGFASEDEVDQFFHDVPEFERMLVRSGIRLVKYWFSITDAEQQLRFLMRIHDPLKQWKLSPMDLESRRRWEDYTKAKEDTLAKTNIPEAPWYIVEGNDKKRARLNCIDHLLNLIPMSRSKVKRSNCRTAFITMNTSVPFCRQSFTCPANSDASRPVSAMRDCRCPGVLIASHQTRFGQYTALCPDGRPFLMRGVLGGTIAQGQRRGPFSNKSSLGSAPNVAAAADVGHPINQGITQSFSVFIGTINICTCTALMILAGGVYQPDADIDGVVWTQNALADSLGGWTSYVLTVAVLLFAFSSIIYNYYLSENAPSVLTGNKSAILSFKFALMAIVV